MSNLEQPQPVNSELQNDQTNTSRRQPNLKVAVIAAIVVTVLVAGLFVILATRNGDRANSPGPIRVSGIPTTISTPLANLMALSPIPKTKARPFTLTDQSGHPISLASLKGRAVVLDFMDPHCTDICPIISQELIDAYKDLGTHASHVVFLAVNVNRFHTSVAAMKTFTDEHSLNTIPTWHFLTGSPALLKSIWANYGVSVFASSPTAEVIHSSIIFFIDATGRERYLANPTDLHTAGGKAYLPAEPLAEWGKGIAMVVDSLGR